MAIDINKIQIPSNSRVQTTTTQKESANTASGAAKAQTAGRADSVEITAQAQQLQGVQSQMASLPEIDDKKVAEIKSAIAEGRYKIDPEKLAANIGAFESELSQLNAE